MACQLDAFRQAAHYTRGRDRPIEYITSHYWGVNGQIHQNIVDLFSRGPGTSAHEVISGGRVSPIVRPEDTAWSNGNWDSNTRSYSLECRPEMSPADFETVAELIADLCRSWGRIVPLRPHADFTSTSFPGPRKTQIPRLYARPMQYYQTGSNNSVSQLQANPSQIGNEQMLFVYLRDWHGKGKHQYAVTTPGYWLEFNSQDVANGFAKQIGPVVPVQMSFWKNLQNASKNAMVR